MYSRMRDKPRLGFKEMMMMMMLGVWQEYERIVYYKLLPPPGKTIDLDSRLTTNKVKIIYWRKSIRDSGWKACRLP